MVVIWYRIHCQKQNEWKALDAFRKNMPKVALKNAFVFTYDRMRRFQGTWHLERQLIFPGYIFLESEDEEALAGKLWGRERMEGIFPGGGRLLPMKNQEEKFLKTFLGNEHHLGMSKGVIRNGVMQITEGPLQGMEERIGRIDRHKRLARLEVPVSSVSESILAGLEIMDKS